MDDFPSMKAAKLLAILMRRPLGYRIVRQSGSHRILEASGRPRLSFAFHDRQTIRPRTVERVLCDQAGLDRREARRLL